MMLEAYVNDDFGKQTREKWSDESEAKVINKHRSFNK